MTSLLKWLTTNAIGWDIGQHSALRTKRASSAKPSLTMGQQDWNNPFEPAHLSQITIMGLEPRVQLDVASRSENFLADTVATYSLDLLLQSLLLPNLYHFGCYSKNNYEKIHPSTSLFLGWTNVFPQISVGSWVSYYLIVKKSFPAFQILQLLQSW